MEVTLFEITTEVIAQLSNVKSPMLVMLLLISMSPAQQALLGVALSMQPTIYKIVGDAVGVPEEGAIVGLAVGLVEIDILNIPIFMNICICKSNKILQIV